MPLFPNVRSPWTQIIVCLDYWLFLKRAVTKNESCSFHFLRLITFLVYFPIVGQNHFILRKWEDRICYWALPVRLLGISRKIHIPETTSPVILSGACVGEWEIFPSHFLHWLVKSNIDSELAKLMSCRLSWRAFLVGLFSLVWQSSQILFKTPVWVASAQYFQKGGWLCFPPTPWETEALHTAQGESKQYLIGSEEVRPRAKSLPLGSVLKQVFLDGATIWLRIMSRKGGFTRKYYTFWLTKAKESPEYLDHPWSTGFQ